MEHKKGSIVEEHKSITILEVSLKEEHLEVTYDVKWAGHFKYDGWEAVLIVICFKLIVAACLFPRPCRRSDSAGRFCDALSADPYCQILFRAFGHHERTNQTVIR